MGISQAAISKRLAQTQASFIMKKRYQIERVNNPSDQI